MRKNVLLLLFLKLNYRDMNYLLSLLIRNYPVKERLLLRELFGELKI